MNRLVLPDRHWPIRNGTHLVLLCRPDRLASYEYTAKDKRAITCMYCLAALREDEENELKREVRRRMNDQTSKKDDWE